MCVWQTSWPLPDLCARCAPDTLHPHHGHPPTTRHRVCLLPGHPWAAPLAALTLAASGGATVTAATLGGRRTPVHLGLPPGSAARPVPAWPRSCEHGVP